MDSYFSLAKSYLRTNGSVVLALSLVLLAGYGFELFNLNLTIDEEIHGFSSQAFAWMEQGRWGMYLLNRFVVPQPVVPVVPLLIALVFYLAAILILMECWGIEARADKIVVGSIACACPTIAYMFTFSTLNFGIGISMFLVAVAVLVHKQAQGLAKLAAAAPGALAIAVYQGMALTLAFAFLVQFLAIEGSRKDAPIIKSRLISMLGVGLLAALGYYAVQKLFLLAFAANITYIGQYFDSGNLQRGFAAIGADVANQMLQIYGGSPEVYGTRVGLMAVVLVAATALAVYRFARGSRKLTDKLLLCTLTLGLLLLPCAPGLLMGGALPIRFFVFLPVVLGGLVMLGFTRGKMMLGVFSSVVVGLCTLQFVMATNTLFSASALALEADRLLASRLLERIADAAPEGAAQGVKYLEVVGYVDRPATRLVPKIDTFGASFFEWEQGNVYRIILFLKTLDHTGFEGLPPARRFDLVSETRRMPNWPAKGSIRVLGDTAIIKFGPYSDRQKSTICNSLKPGTACSL